MSTSRLNRFALIIGPLAIAALMWVMSGWTGLGGDHAGIALVMVLTLSLPTTVAWLIAALGLGWPLRAWLAGELTPRWLVQMCLGIGVLLWLDALLGRLGVWIPVAQLAWLLLGVGIGLAVAQAVRGWRDLGKDRRTISLPPWLTWAAAPCVAVLLVAASNAPGWLWRAEFDGYDALAYHLQLPREWLEAGAITGLPHNVYSYLPGFVEAAYLHLAALTGDAITAAASCQLLHGGLAILTALAASAVAWRRMGRSAGAAALVLVLGTPWVVLVGSLAYNEMAVALMLACGLLVLDQSGDTSPHHRGPARLGAMVGLFAAVAIGAKLTAVGFVAAPLGVLMLWRTPPRRWPVATSAAAAAALIVLAPYLVGNAIATGNPVFPFGAGWFGTGHWSLEQVTTWRAGHANDLDFLGKLSAAWNQLLRCGLGPPPSGAPWWQPLWSVLPALTAIGLIMGLRDSRTRRWSAALLVVLIIQCAFWLQFTHLQSRFMLPAVVPGALATVTGGWLTAKALAKGSNRWRWAMQSVLLLLLLTWCSLPMVIFSRERDGAPAALIGGAHLLTGDPLTDAQRAELAERWPQIYVNHLLPPSAHVLMIGEATPLYYRSGVTSQSTWDRGPMSRVMRAHPDQPKQWIEQLVAEGYTHLLVNRIMLQIWEAEGWNDPLITDARITGAADAHSRKLRSFPDGVVMYELKRRNAESQEH